MKKNRIFVIFIAVIIVICGSFFVSKNQQQKQKVAYDYYETTLSYRVAPYKIEVEDGEEKWIYGTCVDSVMNSLVLVLNSDAFGEEILKDGILNGLSEEESATGRLSKIVRAISFERKNTIIYVYISVRENKALAESLRDKLIKILPSYIERNISIPEDYTYLSVDKMSTTDQIKLVRK